jgi:hypothetical protein
VNVSAIFLKGYDADTVCPDKVGICEAERQEVGRRVAVEKDKTNTIGNV